MTTPLTRSATPVTAADAARPPARSQQPRTVQAVDVEGLRAAVAMARGSVDRCDLASGFLLLDGGSEFTEASHPMAADLDRAQRELGNGPGLLACETSTVISSDDLRAEPRWPSLGAHARRCGIGAVASIPLLPSRRFPSWHGWLTLYSHRRGAFPPSSIALARALALYCSSTVDTDLHTKHLQAALASRDLIGQAKGIIMARKNVDDAQAFEILKRASQHSNLRLRDVAEAVVRSCGRDGIDRGSGVRAQAS